jgi:hypothetical protein
MISTNELLKLQHSKKAHSYLYIGPPVCQFDVVQNELNLGPSS